MSRAKDSNFTICFIYYSESVALQRELFPLSLFLSAVSGTRFHTKIRKPALKCTAFVISLRFYCYREKSMIVIEWRSPPRRPHPSCLPLKIYTLLVLTTFHQALTMALKHVSCVMAKITQTV